MTIQHARSASPYQSPVSLMVEIDERVRLFDSTGHGTLALATDLDPTSHHQVVVTLLDPGNHESTLEFEGIWVDKDAVMKQPQKQHGSVTPFSASTLPQHTIYDLSQAYTQTTQKMVEVVSPMQISAPAQALTSWPRALALQLNASHSVVSTSRYCLTKPLFRHHTSRYLLPLWPALDATQCPPLPLLRGSLGPHSRRWPSRLHAPSVYYTFTSRHIALRQQHHLGLHQVHPHHPHTRLPTFDVHSSHGGRDLHNRSTHFPAYTLHAVQAPPSPPFPHDPQHCQHSASRRRQVNLLDRHIRLALLLRLCFTNNSHEHRTPIDRLSHLNDVYAAHSSAYTTCTRQSR